MQNKKFITATIVFLLVIAALFATTVFADEDNDESVNITVTIIGDSVALGAQTTLVKYIPNCYVDAKVSRTIKTGYDLMMELQENGELREYVVIALGTNGHYNYAALFTQIIDDLEEGHKLILVTPYDGRTNENSKIVNKTAEWMRKLSEEYEYITIADWNTLVGTQSEVLAGDKVHMKGQISMVLYTNCIINAINTAWSKPSK
jgi:hypothetical protein